MSNVAYNFQCVRPFPGIAGRQTVRLDQLGAGTCSSFGVSIPAIRFCGA